MSVELAGGRTKAGQAAEVEDDSSMDRKTGSETVTHSKRLFRASAVPSENLSLAAKQFRSSISVFPSEYCPKHKRHCHANTIDEAESQWLRPC
jgi:hypothetical protein